MIGLEHMLELDLKLCGECGGCVAVCAIGALELHSDGLKINHKLCTVCESCLIFCPTGALRVKTGVGKSSSPSKTLIPHSENGRKI